MSEGPSLQLVCPSCATKNRLPERRVADGPVCGRCGAALLPLYPIALDDRSFDAYVEGSGLPVLVDFWADWCGPCKAMAPQFSAAAAQVPRVRFAKVDTEAAPQTSVRQRIRSIPTLLLFRDGRELARSSGAMAAGDIVAWLDGRLR
ncbi:MAG: thioredoxin TrxC [Ideonella sp.]|nr:thioredoxin TrxC [Ideonella sp.]MCC7457106.1 thioredoxin TrxC [Nitrospira sp.]